MALIDDQGNHGFDYSPSLSRLLSMPHKRAMIDMPIGLKMSGHRRCDIGARELVGSSIFLGARRNLWEFPDQASANRYYWRQEGPACACAVAARDSNARLGGDEVDSRGLRMEINY